MGRLEDIQDDVQTMTPQDVRTKDAAWLIARLKEANKTLELVDDKFRGGGFHAGEVEQIVRDFLAKLEASDAKA